MPHFTNEQSYLDKDIKILILIKKMASKLKDIDIHS
jgi:hypothetical protein